MTTEALAVQIEAAAQTVRAFRNDPDALRIALLSHARLLSAASAAHLADDDERTKAMVREIMEGLFGDPTEPAEADDAS
jgi:hypothetical protein